ncbi:MAG: DUF1704 domain-containing protein [bacterium]|nr:DUF1704 domain-containing protein [bacterium]
MRQEIANIIQEAEKHLNFSTLLHPLNADAQKEGFLSDKIEEPTFMYIDAHIPDVEFPVFDDEGSVADLYRERMDHVSLLAGLLKAVGNDAVFTQLSLDVLPIKSISLDKRHEKSVIMHAEATFDAPMIAERFMQALAQIGCTDWSVEIRNNISSRLTADQWEKLLIIREDVVLSEDALHALIRHEIGVHVLRSINGAKQAEPILHVGTTRGRLIEEGVAIYMERKGGPLSSRVQLRHQAVTYAQTHSFRETWQMLREHGCSKEGAWRYTVRVKRGLIHGASHGGFTRDAFYAQGYEEMKRCMANGFNLAAVLSAPIHPEEIDLFDLEIFALPEWS